MSSHRQQIYINSAVSSEPLYGFDAAQVTCFHARLPGYTPSPVRFLPELAAELKVDKVLIKDESNRFGLPSFKILGASWGCFRAVTSKLNLPVDTNLENLKEALEGHSVKLFAATDGNHGRAVALMASILNLPSFIFVPGNLDQPVKDAISNQGGVVIDVDGNYDQAVKEAGQKAREEDGTLVQDTAWEGYEDIPRWIVEGYGTIFAELDEQLAGIELPKRVLITPVGVGSLAHAVVLSCKSRQPATKIVTVEPNTAACLYESLRAGKAVVIDTSFTIMTGMDCGTVSYTAYGDLKRHVDYSVTISDHESHLATRYLNGNGVRAGPCGAAGVAAARHLATSGLLDKETSIILLNTEGPRSYPIPYDVNPDNSVDVTQSLVETVERKK